MATDVRTDTTVMSTPNRDPTRAARVGLLQHLNKLRGDLTFDLVLNDVAVRSGSGFLQTSLGVETQVLTSEQLDLKLRAGYTLGEEYGHQIRQAALGWGVRFRGARSVCDIDYSWQDYPHESDETSVGDHHVSITIYPRVLKAKDKAPPGRDPSWADQTWNPPDFERDVCIPGSQQKLGASVHAREIHIGKEKFVLFLVELDADARVAEWKLHIYPGDAGNIGEDPAGSRPLRTLQGWAMPASSILWNLRADGNKVSGGTYCCRLEISGPGGNSRSSGLTQFRVR